MSLQRRANQKVVRADEEGGNEALLDTPTARQRSPYISCTICGLVCFGLVMALIGGTLGMYFKAHLQEVYKTTAGQLDQLSGSGLHKQAAQRLMPFWKAAKNTEAAIEAAANAATGADGRQLNASWAKPLFVKTVCDDSCPSSKNQQCEDGRSGDGQVACDLGTDCSDCGAWDYLLPNASSPVPAPIKYLRDHSTAVNVARTSTVPSFIMPYTNPDQDIDVSHQMHTSRVVELGLTQAWFKTLNGKCQSHDGARALVLDVGANFGYYTFYAASHGCRVVSWEPVPLFRSFLEYGILVNNMSEVVRVRDHVVGAKPGREYEMTVPLQGIWGTASVNGRNIDDWTVGEHRETVTAVSERVDALIHEDALLIKLDVEGFEPSAFQSMKGVFANHKVEAFFMEYSPGVYEHGKMWEDLPEMPQMLTHLLEHNFTILHINDSLARGTPLLSGSSWSGPMPALEEVTMDNMLRDLEDVRQIQQGILGCYAPNELARLNGKWESCNALPEDLDPKGFRGTFGHNTNIWAAAKRESLEIGGAVGIQAPDQPSTDWYGKDLRIGMGGRWCDRVAPGDMVLRHRCPCPGGECTAEAQLVEKLAAANKMRKLTNRAN